MTLNAAHNLLRRVKPRTVGLLVLALALFVLALQLMQTGAAALSPVVQDLFKVGNPASGLGFGWLSAYLVMSGSPIAAASLTFYDVGVMDATSTFAMITGSRLGASFGVLLIGTLYVLRGHERETSLSSGLLSLMITASIYLPALPLGLWLLDTGWFETRLLAEGGRGLNSLIDLVYTPVVEFAARYIPQWIIFLVGVGVIILSFNLFDKILPGGVLEDSAFDNLSRLLYRPIVTFMLGFGITLLTMSVSVSLGMLVPLSVRGYIRRENIVPYIMGCNISTFIDTLYAGLLLGNPGAAAIVLAQMISLFIVSALVLLFLYRPYQRTLLRALNWVTHDTPRLIAFFTVIFAVPLALLLFG